MATSWTTTRFALAKLEELLHCPICNHLMTDPHMITTCEHCFCRDCVVTTLCHGGNSCCPLCGLPSWIKDVRPNYQLINIINYIHSINVILNNINSQETPITSSSDQKIERRIRSRPKCNLKLNVTPAVTVTTRNRRWATDFKRNNMLDSVTISGSKRKIVTEAKTQPTSLVKRLKRVDEEFPFSPMISKMRSFSKLDSTSKIQRLKASQSLVPNQELSSPLQQSKLERFFSKSEKPYHSESTPAMSLCRAMRKNKRGETHLHIAAIKGDIVNIKMLLQQGADPNVKDNAGWTPLHEACNHGHYSIVKELLNNGAIVNIPGYHNNTPLHDAVENGNIDIVKLLISNGANDKMRNHHGFAPIDMAVTDIMKSVLLNPGPQELSIIKRSPNSVVSSRRNIVVLASGLGSHQKCFLKSTVSMLHGSIVEEFCKEVTHIITVCDENKCCSRTLKCLYAVVNGKWLLSYQWVLCSNESHKWIDEENYEIKGFVVNGENWITEAPHKGRDNSDNLKAPGLFDGCEFYFSGSFNYPMPSKDGLIQLVLQAGGKVLNREPKEDDAIFSSCYPFHAPPNSVFGSCHILIISQLCDYQKTGNIAHLPASWILDSISCFRLIEFHV